MVGFTVSYANAEADRRSSASPDVTPDSGRLELPISPSGPGDKGISQPGGTEAAGTRRLVGDRRSWTDKTANLVKHSAKGESRAHCKSLALEAPQMRSPIL